MSLNAATIWEVRTSGNSANGGGFYNRTPGTSVDYSQQDAAQLSLTDLASTSASGWLTLTSATGGFTAAMVGNLIYIASGTNFTAGYYEITAYTDTNTVTLDRACGASSNASGGSGKVGGASDHPNTIAASVVAGNKIWIKSGTYQKQGANAYVLKVMVASSNQNIITWEGYDSARDDKPTGTGRPLFDGNSSATNCLIDNGSSYATNFFKHLRFASATSHGVSLSKNHALRYCKSSGNGGDGFHLNSDGTGQRMFLFYCEAGNNSGYGFYAFFNGACSHMEFCYSHDNSSGGSVNHAYANSSSTALGCIFDSNTGSGISGMAGWEVVNCVAYNNTGATSDGFQFSFDSGYTTRGRVYNNIAMNNGRYGFNSTDSSKVSYWYFDYNLYYGNGTAGLYLFTAGPHDVASDPLFTDAANGDFSLQSGSPAKDVGIPGTSMAGATI